MSFYCDTLWAFHIIISYLKVQDKSTVNCLLNIETLRVLIALQCSVKLMHTFRKSSMSPSLLYNKNMFQIEKKTSVVIFLAFVVPTQRTKRLYRYIVKFDYEYN